MPSNQRRIKIILGALLLLFVGGLIWFFQTSASSHPSTTMDDGSAFSIVDAATKPNEEFYIGVPWKRGFALLLKNSASSLKKNFGHLSVTNQSAISWQRKYFTNATTTNIFAYYRDPIDIVRLVDAQGVEHAPQPFFSLTDKQPNGELIDCGVFLFNTNLQPPVYLRIYGRDATNVVTFSK